MGKIMVGGDGNKQYEENYDRIFRKKLRTRSLDWFNALIIKIFLNGRRKNV